MVEETGPAVNDLSPGDRVVIDQGLNCVSLRRETLCEYCHTGDSHQCEFYAEHGITGLPGGLAEFIAVPAVNAIPIRTDLRAAEAAMAEPLGCVIHACDAAMRARSRYHLNGSPRPSCRIDLVTARVRADVRPVSATCAWLQRAVAGERAKC